ncbi:MAG: hypothetical protein J0L82_11635 [Deltaproteobacteria bacterium]|jgi:hypothetical protein|nr:hypothetical protein [Deltaproteobacteria bacterium]
MKTQKNFKWLLLALALTLLSVWIPLAADAATGKRNAKSEESAPATVFSCRAFPNERPDLIQYGYLHTGSLKGILVLANGMSIELERTQPGRLTYRYMRGAKLITHGAIEASTSQFAMSAGGPWGAELHCVTAKE